MENAPPGTIDVMELCGGQGSVARVSIRRRLRAGPNVDLVTGTDFSDPAEANKLIDFIEKYKPELVAAGPPCKAMANWSWEIANLVARIAMMQMKGNRFVVIENPRYSDLFDLGSFNKLWRTGEFGMISFPQCALGLTVDGEPILKWTALLSNSRKVSHQ